MQVYVGLGVYVHAHVVQTNASERDCILTLVRAFH
jgi:hypothetical protein